MTAVTLAPVTHPLGVVWEICGYNMFCSDAVVVLLFNYVPVATKPLVWFVVWEPHSGRKQSCFFLPSPGVNVFEESVHGEWCVV
jgi:hypothetical protein